MTLARCLPACNAPLRLDIEPAVTMPVNWWAGPVHFATLRPERITLRCSHCGRLREFHPVIEEPCYGL